MAVIASRWRIEPGECYLGFSVMSFGLMTVHGRFDRVRGGFAACDDGSLTDIWAEIEAERLTTGIGRRDRHLRSPDFLHVRRHPKIRFSGGASAPDDRGRRIVEGDLQIRGVDHPVRLGAYETGSRAGQFVLAGSLDRRSFGVTHLLDRLRFVIGTRVDVDMRIQAVPAVAPVTRPLTTRRTL